MSDIGQGEREIKGKQSVTSNSVLVFSANKLCLFVATFFLQILSVGIHLASFVTCLISSVIVVYQTRMKHLQSDELLAKFATIPNYAVLGGI